MLTDFKIRNAKPVLGYTAIHLLMAGKTLTSLRFSYSDEMQNKPQGFIEEMQRDITP